MDIKKYAKASALVLGLVIASCSNDDFTDSIFPDVPTTADPETATYKFDTWLNQNYRDVYNLDFVYRMEDIMTSYDFNLTPATLSNAQIMAVLTKYVWYDAYAEAYGGSADNLDPAFIKANGPKIIHLIGSRMWNNDGTITYGYASGGVQITLTSINYADFNSIQTLNNLYFHTMHHEFTHILHQRRSYPTEFNLLSNGKYDGSNWQNRNGGVCASLGLITPYAGSNYTEDFAETVSNYITRTDEDYAMIYWCAERGWYSGDDETDQSTAYCYYYYKNETDRNNEEKTYTLRFSSDTHNSHIRLFDPNGMFYSTPEDCDKYLEDLEKGLKDTYKENESWNRYNKSYEDLDTTEAAAIDALADAVTFVFPCEDSDKVNGREILEQKITIARNWFRDSWNLDLDNLRKVVQRRSADYDLEKLLKQIDDIPVPGK